VGNEQAKIRRILKDHLWLKRIVVTPKRCLKLGDDKNSDAMNLG
jgi:hypothetical protein